MRTFAIFLVSFLTLASITLAHEVTTAPTGAQIGNVRAGVTPDSFLYTLDVAIDNLRYLLTFDNTAKTRVGLEIARERLLEVREMVLENKVNAAQRAQGEHVKTLERVKSSITVVSRVNSIQELNEVIDLEKEVEEHETEVETVSEELKIKIKVKGEITPEQQALVDSVLNLMQNKTGEVKIKIENKKGETKIKIKLQTGKSDEEVEDEVEKLERRAGLLALKQEKAEEKIEEAAEELAEVKSKVIELNATNITAVNVLISQAEEHLNRAQVAFNQSEFGEAFGQAIAVKRLAENAKRILEKTLEIEVEVGREIEVEIKEGIAKIKVEIGKLRLKYSLPTSDREEIVADIATKTGLSVEEINSIIEFEAAEVKGKKIIQCLQDVSEAREFAKGKVCTQIVQNLRCPYDETYTYLARNGCEISFLEDKGWEPVETESQPKTVNVTVTQPIGVKPAQ